MPDTELRKWMIDKQHPNGLPEERDADAPPAIFLMRKDYVPVIKIIRTKGLEFKAIKAKKVSFSDWIILYERKQPAFKEDPHGKSIVVTYADRTVATEEWWRALKNPAAIK